MSSHYRCSASNDFGFQLRITLVVFHILISFQLISNFLTYPYIADAFQLSSSSVTNKRTRYSASKLSRTSLSSTFLPVESNENKDIPVQKKLGAISMNVDELAEVMQGRGRARLVWDMYRIGVDPLIYFNNNVKSKESTNLVTDHPQNSPNIISSTKNLITYIEHSEENHESIQNLLPTSRKTQGLGVDALINLASLYEQYGGGLEGKVGTLSFVSTSSDGTTKLLIKLHDGLEVETVIIPWFDKGWSTVCISSQVGCLQGMRL